MDREWVQEQMVRAALRLSCLSLSFGPQLAHAVRSAQFIVLAGTWILLLSNETLQIYILGRPSVAGPVFARVFGPQTGVQKNHFFRSLEGAKSLENL